MRGSLSPLWFSLVLTACANGASDDGDTDPVAGADTDTDAAADTDDGSTTDTDTSPAGFEAVPNGSFEADVVEDGAYASSMTAMTMTGWSYDVSEHGYVSMWGGWTRDGEWGDLPAPGGGRQYVRIELWNQAKVPSTMHATLSTQAFGAVTGGTSCTLRYALSEVGDYTIPPLTTTIRWSETGAVVDPIDEDVATATGYDVNSRDGAWLEMTLPVAFPIDAEGEAVTVSFEASATNLGPGQALAVLVDNVRVTCD